MRACVSALLSEMPQRWRESVARLDRMAVAPSEARMRLRAQAEYLFYQTLLAAQPLDADRAWAYMLKAAREAKAETSWIEPNQAYEADLEQFVRGMIADPDVEAEIAAVLASMTPEWQMLSLSQTSDQAHRTRYSGHLSGLRALGSPARGSGQPDAGGLRRPTRPARAR